MPFNELVQRRISDPLAIKDTHWILPQAKMKRMVVFYPGKPGSPTTQFSGSAGLVNTARDYLPVEQMLVTKDELFGRRLLTPVSVATMSKSQVSDLYAKTKKGGPGKGLGYTVAVTLDPKLANDGRNAGAFGWGVRWERCLGPIPCKSLQSLLWCNVRRLCPPSSPKRSARLIVD